MIKEKEILQELLERYPVLKVLDSEIWEAFEIMVAAYSEGKKLLVAGNGGSAADAEHIVGELMKGFVKSRRLNAEASEKLLAVDSEMGRTLANKLQEALPSIALVNHVALSTAYLNDMDPLLGFAQQLYGYGMEGDMFFAISTSGNSKNILYACTAAKAKGIKIIGLTGKDGGKLKDICDVALVVPEEETFKIQELHLPIYHALCLMLEERFFEIK